MVLLGERVECELAPCLHVPRDVVGDGDPQLRDGLEALRAGARRPVGEGEVGAVVVAVDVLAVPAAGKSCTRWTLLPAGQIGYLSDSRSAKPEQVQVARAFAGPRLVGLASPVSARRKRGIALTLPVGLPRYSISTAAGRTMPPVLPGSSRSGPLGSGSAWPFWLPASWPLPRVQAASLSRPSGRRATRPMEITIRSIVAVRFACSAPSTPPSPGARTRRSSASAICLSSSARLRSTSARA